METHDERRDASKLDWRNKSVSEIAHDTITPEGKIWVKGTPVTVRTYLRWNDEDVDIGVPSAPALYLNHSYKAYEKSLSLFAFSTDSNSSNDGQTQLAFDFFEEAIASIVFAYMALEVFANEQVPSTFCYQHSLPSGLYRVRGKEWIERNLSLEEKLDQVLPDVLSKPSPKGLAVWGDFVHLRRLRHRVTHLKSFDLQHSKVWNLYPNSIWNELMKRANANYPLIAKRMIVHFVSEASTHWLRNCPF